MLNTVERDSDELNKKSATIMIAMRRACKNILYTIANSGNYVAVAEEVPVEETAATPVETVKAPAEEPVNKMDQLFLQINVIAGGALAVLEVLLLIWAVLKAKKNKKAAA